MLLISLVALAEGLQSAGAHDEPQEIAGQAVATAEPHYSAIADPHPNFGRAPSHTDFRLVFDRTNSGFGSGAFPEPLHVNVQEVAAGQSRAATVETADSSPTMRVEFFGSVGESDARDRSRLALVTAGGFLGGSPVAAVYLPGFEGVPSTNFPGVIIYSTNPDHVDEAATLALPETNVNFSTRRVTNEQSSIGTSSVPAPEPMTDAFVSRYGAASQWAPDGVDAEGLRFGVEAHSSRHVVKSLLDVSDPGALGLGVEAPGPLNWIGCRPSVSLFTGLFCYRTRDAVATGIADPTAFPGDLQDEREFAALTDFQQSFVRRQTDRVGLTGSFGKAFAAGTGIGDLLITAEVQAGVDQWDFDEVETFAPATFPTLAPDAWARSGDGRSYRVGLGVSAAGELATWAPLSWSVAAEYGADFIDLELSADESPNAYGFLDYYASVGVPRTQSLNETMVYGSVGARLDFAITRRLGLFAAAEKRWDAFVTDTWLSRTPSVLGPEVSFQLKNASSSELKFGVSYSF